MGLPLPLPQIDLLLSNLIGPPAPFLYHEDQGPGSSSLDFVDIQLSRRAGKVFSAAFAEIRNFQF
jgi:hypothetical protein